MIKPRSLTYIIIIVLIIGIAVYAEIRHSHSDTATSDAGMTATTQQTAADRTLTTTVAYSCDKGKTITVAYYEGPEMPQPAPGEMPTPTGTADVSLDGGATTTLNQTISADGVRYATADDSFVVWNKGKDVLVMRDNSMDLDYTNCTQQ